MQVNNYETKAAYEADNTRSRTASAVSKIVEESAAIFDGVNTVVYDKNLAGIGDLVVKDTVRNVLAFIKAGTVKRTQIPATLKPVAEVFGRKGDKVHITALENLSARWGHPFEVLISGINNALGGTLAIVVHNNGADGHFALFGGEGCFFQRLEHESFVIACAYNFVKNHSRNIVSQILLKFQ